MLDGARWVGGGGSRICLTLPPLAQLSTLYTMPTLILSPRQTDDAQALWRAAIARGWDVVRLKTWKIPDSLSHCSEPFLYVEALFGSSLAEELGVELLNPPEDWLCRLPEKYRRRQIRLATFGEARSLSPAAFIKPPNDKSFPAAVYAPAELPQSFESEMSVLISEPVRFLSEYRCFVLERIVVAFSMYARDGEPSADEASASECQQLLAFVSELLVDGAIDLPRAFVVDCGPIEDRGWAVIELNAAWGSGIYRCDPDQVLDVVRAANVTKVSG